MSIPRVIPCLLLRGDGLVKTAQFRDPKYVGDAMNAVRIFNDKGADELIFLDILATVEGRGPRLDFIRDIATECFMPLCYGGGIRTLQEIENILSSGVEKVALNASAFDRADLIREASRFFGAQSLVVAIDVKRSMLGRYECHSHGGKRGRAIDPCEHARRVEDLGAGEILINSIDRDGTGKGYDEELIRKVTEAVDIPVIASGGAGQIADLKRAIDAGASAVAAGSLFVFHGKHRAVLITYPARPVLERLFGAG